MKSYFAIILLAFMSLSAIAADMPNIVIIYADDMGHGDISCQNQNSKIQTPHLDQLAAEGIRFTDGHSSSGVCSPSRYALLSGNYHWRRSYHFVNSFGIPYFKKGELTLPCMLKAKGYNTAMIGKWHLGWDWKSIRNPGAKMQTVKKRRVWTADAFDWSKPIFGGPVDNGFNTYFGDGTINFPPYCWIQNNKVTEAPTENLNLNGMKTKEGGWEFRSGPMVKGWNPYEVLPTLAKKSVEFINNQPKDKPFFLYFSLPSPHAPIIPNDQFKGKSEAGAYGDFVVQTDWITGQLLKAIKDRGFDKNTIIIFSSDNGPEKYAFSRAKKHSHRSMGELRGLKRDIWEGGHRVPFIIKWPGNIKPGSVSSETINQVDIMATVASIVDYKLPNDAAVDSYNLVPLLKGKDYNTPLREASVHNTNKNKFALRQGDWVYLNTYTGAVSNPPSWFLEDSGHKKLDDKTAKGLLYNLKDDLAQKNDLYEKYPEKVKAMEALLEQYRTSGRSVSTR